MWWKIIIESVLVIGVTFLGPSFWVCAKARRHFVWFIRDRRIISEFFGTVSHDKLIAEAAAIHPVFGSFPDNMAALGKVHFYAMDHARNLTFVGVLVILAASYWLGIYFCIANLILFFLLGIRDLTGYAMSNSATHARELIGNVYKWYQIDPEACSAYCCQDNPMFSGLYSWVALNLPRKVEGD